MILVVRLIYQRHCCLFLWISLSWGISLTTVMTVQQGSNGDPPGGRLSEWVSHWDSYGACRVATCSPACFVRRSHFLGREKSKSKTKRGPRKKGTREKRWPKRQERRGVFRNHEWASELVSEGFSWDATILKNIPNPKQCIAMEINWRIVWGSASKQYPTRIFSWSGSSKSASYSARAILAVQGRSQVRGQMGRLLR